MPRKRATRAAALQLPDGTMFGCLRLFLAASVVAFHAGVQPGGIYIGVSAVVVFYMLSGFAISGLLATRFPTISAMPAFLAERFVRLAPQYYLCLAIAFIFVFVLRWSPIAEGKPSWWTLFSYLTLIPLGLQRFIGDVDFPFIPQATSLAIEVIMYLIAPFIVRSRALSGAAAIVCLAVFLATATGHLPAAIYTYYTAPAPLIFFILGSFMYRRDWIPVALIVLTLATILVAGRSAFLSVDMLVGLIFGVPAILLIRGTQSGPFDTAVGNAAYGCFLGQILIFDFIIYFGLAAKGTLPYILLSIAASCLFGYLAYWLVERPTVAFRRSIKAPVGRADGAEVAAPYRYCPPVAVAPAPDPGK